MEGDRSDGEAPTENVSPPNDAPTIPGRDDKPKPTRYPGCFKKALAFVVDAIVFSVIGLALYPFSEVFESLGEYNWLPWYLVGAVYFAVFESGHFGGQTLGKKVFSLGVYSAQGEAISAWDSFGRYAVIIFPFFSGPISGSVASTIGATDTLIGDAIYSLLVVALLAGNIMFMLMHPQKRGLHDLLVGSIVARKHDKPQGPIVNLAVKPFIGGVAATIAVVSVLGFMFYRLAADPDFNDVSELTQRVKVATSNHAVAASYRKFLTNGKQTMFAIEVQVPISYRAIQQSDIIKAAAEDLYPVIKRANRNPNVDTLVVIYSAHRFIGAIPLTRSHRFATRIANIR